MQTDEKKVTLDEYMQMPIGAPYQYINGYLVDWPSRTPAHQLALGALSTQIANFVDKTGNDGLCILGPIETIFDDLNSFQPDFVYISKERSDIIKDYLYGAPDLVVEVLWEKNAYYDLRQKKDIYEKYGVKEYIIVDPMVQTVELYALRDNAYYLHKKAQRSEPLSSLILSGLVFDLNKIFK